MSSVLTRGPVRAWTVALRLLLLTVVMTVLYTVVITLIGQVALPAQANGSVVTSDGKVVGSALIGQSFTDTKGNALPQWFQSRPSAAGDGYDGGASSGSNLGPNNPDLLKAIEARKAAITKDDGAGADPGRRGHRVRLRTRPPHLGGVRAAAGRPGRERPRARGVEGPCARRAVRAGAGPRLPRPADRERAAAEHRAGRPRT